MMRCAARALTPRAAISGARVIEKCGIHAIFLLRSAATELLARDGIFGRFYAQGSALTMNRRKADSLSKLLLRRQLGNRAETVSWRGLPS